MRNVSIPADLQLKLFDCLVAPILLYSSEIWSYENMEIIERVHIGFLKRVLHVRSSTPNYMVYGETGRYPLIINAKVRYVCFWSKLLLDRKDKLSSTLYRILYSTQETENIQFKWLSHVKKIFDECGFSYIWSSQITINPEAIKVIIKQRLIDHFYQKKCYQIWIFHLEADFILLLKII